MGEYDDLKKADLIALAEERGLDASGTKAEIIARLEVDDVTATDAGADPGPEPPPDTIAPGPVASSIADPPPAPAAPVPTAPVAAAPPAPEPPPAVVAPKPWDALKRDVLQTLRDESADLWEEGKTDVQFLGRVAEDVAREKWRAATATGTVERRRAETNLRHLQAQVRGQVAIRKMALVRGGDRVLERVLNVAIRSVASTALAAIL